MYFSTKLLSRFSKEILKDGYLYFKVGFGIENIAEENLQHNIDIMFDTWKKGLYSKHSVLRKYQNYIRKFVIDYDKQKNDYTLLFKILLQIKISDYSDEQFPELDEFRFKVIRETLHYNWLRFWFYATNNNEIYFDFKMLNSKLEANTLMKNLCSNQKVADAARHQMLGFHGIFNKIQKEYRSEMRVKKMNLHAQQKQGRSVVVETGGE